MGEKKGDWQPVEKTYYNKNGFLALDPFIGCEFVVSEAFHLTLIRSKPWSFSILQYRIGMDLSPERWLPGFGLPMKNR